MKKPGFRPGLFVCERELTAAKTLRRHARRLERRYFRREAVEPFDQLRMALAPFPLEAQVAVAERAGERDLTDAGDRAVRRRVASSTARARVTLPV